MSNEPAFTDALTTGGTPDGMAVLILGQIRDNLSAINRKQDAIDAKVTDMTGRVIRLEERDERIERAEKAIEGHGAKLDALMRDKNQRDGASSLWIGLRGWTPVVIAFLTSLAAIFSGLYLAGRATGTVNPPPTHAENPFK